MRKYLLFFLLFFPYFSSPLFANSYSIRRIFFYSESLALKNIDGDLAEGVFSYELFLPKRQQFFSKMRSFLRKPLDAETLEEIRSATIQHYQQEGYPVVFVAFPEEQPIGETLYVLVIVGKVASIEAVGATYFSNKKIESYLDFSIGEPVFEDKLKKELFWLNRNPFRLTNVILESGEAVGDTNLTFETRDRFPASVHAGYNRSGYNFAGDNRYFVGVKTGRLFFQDDPFHYEWKTADSIEEIQVHKIDYDLPFPWKHLLKCSGYYSLTNPKPTQPFDASDPDGGGDLISKGRNYFLEGLYYIPLQLISKTHANAYFGYQFRRTNNFLLFADELVFDRFIDISQFVFGLDALLENSSMFHFFDLRLFYSPGNMTRNNETRNFSQEREKATSDYIYAKLQYIGEYNLHKRWSFHMETFAQYSPDVLIPSEEFALGGQYSVRGYLENEVIGDIGFLLKNELRLHAGSFLSLFGKKDAGDYLRFLVFVDTGWLTDMDENIFAGKHTFLASVGPGVRYQISRYLHVSVEYGIRLEKITRIFEENSQSSQLHVNLVATY